MNHARQYMIDRLGKSTVIDYWMHAHRIVKVIWFEDSYGVIEEVR
jgi:hypothetical protein